MESHRNTNHGPFVNFTCSMVVFLIIHEINESKMGNRISNIGNQI